MLGNNVIAIDQAAFRLKDIDEGLRFFNRTLGFEINFSLQHEGLRVIMLKAGKITIEMWENRDNKGSDGFSSLKEESGISSVEILVKNLEAAVAQVSRNGYSIIKCAYEPLQGIKTAVVLGPENMVVQFVERSLFKQLSGRIMEKVKLKYN